MALASAGCARAHVPADVERGWALYDRMCAVCHGKDGRGYAADRAPAIGGAAFLASATDGYLRDAIADGRRGTTMSAWGRAHSGPLGPADVDAVIAYLRTFSPRRSIVLDERPLAGDAERGVRAYASACAACHGDRGAGGPYVRIGAGDFLADATNGFLREAIRRGRPGTKMPAFEPTLGDGAVDDVVAALRRWQSDDHDAAVPAPPANVPPLPLGSPVLHPHGRDPVGFAPRGATTPADVIKAELDRGARMALLDARAPSDYIQEHIAGAVSVPFYDPSPYYSALPKNVWLVCYCACPHAESGQLAHKLVEKGFTKVTVLDEGLPVWRARGYPVASGLGP